MRKNKVIARGYNPLSVVILMILFVMMVVTPDLNSQIMYNVSKPISYMERGLSQISDLPVIHLNVDENGSLYEADMNIDVKDYMLIEEQENKIIARVRINVDAKYLGEITARFGDVVLNNSSICYVYTNDYQIIAGPISSESINKTINIVKIPAKELILELVAYKKEDISITLQSISFKDLKSHHRNEFREAGCYDCPDYGEIEHAELDLSCNSLGYTIHNHLFNYTKFVSVMDESIPSARSACVILIPVDENCTDYAGRTGTLMHFPYRTSTQPISSISEQNELDVIENVSDCAPSFIFASQHQARIDSLLVATFIINNPSQHRAAQVDSALQKLDNTLIRFNYHHKYGTPWHLSGIVCDEADPTDYQLWRSTIDWDEVIDYCGIRGFAYMAELGIDASVDPDLAIFKMVQNVIKKKFVKLHHHFNLFKF